MSQLVISHLNLEFGGVKALQDISITIELGSVTSIIGPNGAGKSSLLNCVSGFYRSTSGSIKFAEQDIAGLLPYKIARLGISRTFQSIELFTGLSVIENILLVLHARNRCGLLPSMFFLGKASRIEAENRSLAEDIIDFMELHQVRDDPVSALSYGMQKRVELARAFASNPKLILADEPMAGMNAIEKEDLVRFILEINREQGTTIILIEHDLNVVMDISQKIFVLNFGKLICSGPPNLVARDSQVIEAYLGA